MNRAGALALGLVLLVGALAEAAAPPAGRYQGVTFGQGLWLERADGQARAHAEAGRFEEAERLARQAWQLRWKAQGPGHWEALDTGQVVERWRRLAGVPAGARAEVGRSLALERQGKLLNRRGAFVQAEKLLRGALAVRLEQLGEGHADTATGYSDLALCLHQQSKDALALSAFQRALAIRRKALGETHPDTAISYNNLASCLKAQGRSGEALPLYEKALAIRRKALGEGHPTTAISYNRLASCLDAQGRWGEALPLYEKALAVRRSVLGEEHLTTADSYNNLAGCLQDLGRPGEALPLYQKALAVYRKVLGEEHTDTGSSYNNLAGCLHALGRSGEALLLHQKALAVYRKVVGEEHSLTAKGYSNVAACLHALGKPGEALPLDQQALAIHRKALGEDHPDTAGSYFNLATRLRGLGRSREALPLFQKAQAIRRKVLGEGHPDTALCYNEVALCLDWLGKPGEALPLYQKALAAHRKVLGEKHPHTVRTYNNVAVCLNDLGKPGEALPLFQKALAIRLEVQGEDHPESASSYNSLAVCLNDLGKSREALPLFQKALAIRNKVLGEEHPDTASSYNSLAVRRWRQGARAEALRLLQASLPGQEAARFQRATSGFDRALASADHVAPQALLAVGLARLGQPGNAYRHAEAHLARGLLDDLASSSEGARARALRSRLARLDERLVPLFAVAAPNPDQRALRDELTHERRRAGAELARLAAKASARQVLPLEQIQQHLPADGALLLWLDNFDLREHWGCVVRREGRPTWVPLNRDVGLADRLAQALLAPGKSVPPDLVRALRAQRLGPLLPHLKARAGLPEVKQLFVVPVGLMASVPVEVLTDRFAVRYVASGSMLARARAQHRPLSPGPALALCDPTFTPAEAKRPAPPEHGLLLRRVLPGGRAARAGLRPGDVLLGAAGKRLQAPADLREALGAGPAVLTVWREGETFKARLAREGRLGGVVDGRPAPEAVRAWRALEELPVARGAPLARLPGTRLEAEALAKLLPGTTTLLGSAASEQKLDELARTGRLKGLRILHLGTHGLIDHDSPERSGLALARDRPPTPAQNAEAVLKGGRAFRGELTVRDIRSAWQLDCDLVVLSACSTAQGKHAGGDGLLGFAHAFQQAGARSVLLTRWPVEDTATALLMTRFYENLLGKRTGLKGSMKRAEALAEAQSWLRGLGAEEALRLLAKAEPGLVRGPVVRRVEVPLREEARPFAHPYYWAAFVLIGDPD